MSEATSEPQLPPGYIFRPLKKSDYTNQYIETLKVLTVVGDISEAEFDDLYEHWLTLPDIYKPHVITNDHGSVVSTGMLFVEKKLVHQCGKVGHIEDIAVAKSEQGKRLGKAMITRLSEIAKTAGCYKVILDCSPHNAGFYEKCGFSNAGFEMSKRYSE